MEERRSRMRMAGTIAAEAWMTAGTRWTAHGEALMRAGTLWTGPGEGWMVVVEDMTM